MHLNDFNNIQKIIKESTKGSGFQDLEKSGNSPVDEAESPYTNSNHSQNKIQKPFGADAHTKPEGGNPQVCDCITSSGAVPNCPECGGTGQTTSPKRADPKGIMPEADVDEMYDNDAFDNIFGNRQYKKEFEYLDDLQASGITNMFGGARYLVQDLGLDKEKADKVLQMWMRSKEQTEDFQEEETDSDSNEAAVAKMIAKALGDDNRWTEMTAHELYAELESTNTELAKVIQLTAKMLYDVKLTEASGFKQWAQSKQGSPAEQPPIEPKINNAKAKQATSRAASRSNEFNFQGFWTWAHTQYPNLTGAQYRSRQNQLITAYTKAQAQAQTEGLEEGSRKTRKN